jgi:putative flippase GtrA
MDVRKALRFGIAGVIGFAVDAGTLSLLLWATPLGPFSARIIAIAVAMASTWAFNRTFTFGPSGLSLREELVRYASVGLMGSVLNYAIYAGILLVFPQTWPVLAVVCASAVVMAFSWLGYSRFVFQK